MFASVGCIKKMVGVFFVKKARKDDYIRFFVLPRRALGKLDFSIFGNVL